MFYFFLVSYPPHTHTQIDDGRSYYLYSEHRAPVFAMKPFHVECRAIRFIIIFQLKQQLLYDPEKKFTCRETKWLSPSVTENCMCFLASVLVESDEPGRLESTVYVAILRPLSPQL